MTDLIEQGRTALAGSRWQSARDAFERLLSQQPENADALEGLATAAWWLHDEEAVFHARETAYGLFLAHGDLQGASRQAVWLALDSLEFRDQSAVSNGWLQRAKRHLDGLPEVPERCWLDINEGHMALMTRNDTQTAARLGRVGADAARRLKLPEMEALGTGLEGLANVSAGRVVQGMALLDEAGAAVASGQVSDPIITTTIICYIVDACDRVRDIDRAAQWCALMQAHARRVGVEELAAVCRPHYAVLLMWQGAWEAAERELKRSMRDLAVLRPPMAVEPIVRLAELRIRQGRHADAAALLESVRTEPLALLPRAELELAAGKPSMAVELSKRRLQQLSPDDIVERIYPLELLVRAGIASGDMASGAAAEAELKRTAQFIDTPTTQAAALWAAGQIEAANSRHAEATRLLEEAADLYERSEVSYEAARVRMDLADSLSRQGLFDRSAEQAMLALTKFRQLGATGDAASAEARLGKAPTPASALAPPATNLDGLTPREEEILRLLATGESNSEIAVRLVLSTRTVERHVTNIYVKIGASGGTARASATAYAFKRGLLAPTA